MRKDALQAYAAVLGLTLFTVTSSLLLQVLVRPGQELPALRQEIRVLLVGDSTIRQIGSRRLGVPAINLSAPIVNFEYQRALVSPWLDALPELGVVVVGLRSLHLYRDSAKERNGDYLDLTSRGVPWWRLPALSWEERIVLALKGPPGGYYEYWMRGESEAQRFAAQPLHQYRLDVDQAARAVERYEGWFHDGPVRDRNLSEYVGLLEGLKSRGLQVVLLRMPTTESFVEAKSADWLAAEEEMARLAVERGALVWDLHAALALGDQAFLDPVHLGEPGRMAVREELGRRLRQLLDRETRPSL